jgi:hypothetical protein
VGITDSLKKMVAPKKSFDELEEEEERKDLELSIAQKEAAIIELKKRGQDPNHFKQGGRFNFGSIIKWLRTH